MTTSEVSQRRETILLEHDAARLGLYGLTSGASRHAFIHARLNRDRDRLLQLINEGKTEQLDEEIEKIQREVRVVYGEGKKNVSHYD